MTLQAAQYMYKRLRELGVPTAITRDSDTTLGRNERVSKILNAFGNDPNVVVVSNHINAGGSDISNYKGLNLKKIICYNNV